jgi:lysozyme
MVICSQKESKQSFIKFRTQNLLALDLMCGILFPSDARSQGNQLAKIMHRFTSLAGLEFIKCFESFSPTTYLCPAGVPTIGYGHVLLPGEHYQGISMDIAEELLRKDLISAEKAVIRNICQNLEQNQFDALVSFTYNLGSGALQRSTLRQKVNYGASILEIKHEFMKWVNAGGRRLAGLVRRREAEGGMFANNLL